MIILKIDKMNEKVESIKKIISFFTEIDPANIGFETIIDNSVLQGSVKIHMMYGELADNGFKVSNYNNIKTFGELLSILQLGDSNATVNATTETSAGTQSNTKAVSYQSANLGSVQLALGVDIISVNTLPKVLDFRESNFYTDNFSLKEIAYCITKNDPYQSFAGKFAAKEAIVKADNNYKKFKFNEIEVLNDASGKPYCANFSISISHEADIAIAIASVNSGATIAQPLPILESSTNTNNQGLVKSNSTATTSANSNSKWLLILIIINVLLMGYILFNK